MREENEYRVPLAWILLLFGVAFVAIGLALLLYQAQTSVPESAGAGQTGGVADRSSLLTSATALLIMYASLIVLVVGAGVYLLHRWGRRLRRVSRPTSPTEVSDIWSQHRLPEERRAEDGGRN